VGTLDASPQSQATPADAGAASVVPMSARATRLIALAGLASFVLIIVAALVAPPLWNAPGTHASAAHVAAYAQENRGRAIAGLYIYSLALGLFLCFAAGLWSWLRQVEPAPQPLSAVFAFGAIALAVLILAAFATAGVMSYRANQPELVGLLADVTFALLALSGIPTAVCLGAYAALVLRHRCLPAWTGWLAILAVDAHILIAASFMSHGDFLSLEGSVIVWVPATFFGWILATSVVLLRAGTERNQGLTAATRGGTLHG
jgi:hypothetical protein